MADRIRPGDFDEIIGQSLENQISAIDSLQSLILWGPPGSGKTSFSKILAKKSKLHFEETSAVMHSTSKFKSIFEHLDSDLLSKTILLVDDILTTGSTLCRCAELLRQAGAEVLGIVSIFTYGMQKGLDRLAAAKVKNVSLTNFDVIAEEAAKEGYIRPEDISRLIKFRNNPGDESWRD